MYNQCKSYSKSVTNIDQASRDPADVTAGFEKEMDEICAKSNADQEKIRNSISCIIFLPIIFESKKDDAFPFTSFTGFYLSQIFQIIIL